MTALTALATALVLSGVENAASTPTSARGRMHPGDKLTYDLTIEFQLHTLPAPHATQPAVTLDTTAQGTETLTALRADADGTVHASFNLALQAQNNGASQALQRVMLLKIAPDGSTAMEGGGDQSTAQYLAMLSGAAKQFRGHVLHVGDVFHQTMDVPGSIPIRVESTARVTAEKMYRGYPTFAIASTGSGNVDTNYAGARMTGTVDVAGTTYFDQVDQLLVGAATRANVDLQVAGTQGGHATVVVTSNMILTSFKHGPPPTPVPAPTATPAPASPTPAPSPSPATAPTPSGYYTPPPPSPSPSPPSNPYPPS
jgi:hypothetical protein